MDDKRRLAYLIIKHLKSESASGEHSEDISESLEVAIECLEQCYKINTETSSELECGKTLMDIVNQEFKTSDKAKAEQHKIEGNDFMKTGDYAEAVDSYTKAIQVDRNNAVFYSNRAAAYTKLGSNDKALSDCKEAVKIDPIFSRAHGRMGLAYMNMQDYPSAKVSYEKALSLDPANSGYQTNLDLIKEKLKEKKDPESQPRPGGMPGLAGLDIGSLLSNPAVMNMAQSFMQNPQMQQMFSSMMGGAGQGGDVAQEEAASGINPAAAGGLPGGFNLQDVLGASQQFAQNLGNENPELVEQLRSQFKGGEPGEGKDDPQ